MDVTRSVERPTLDLGAAAVLAGQLLGDPAELAELPSERDRNYLVRRTGHEPLVLKIANHDASPALLLAQCEAMERLAGTDVRAPIPVAIDGENITAVNLAGSEHFARLVSYVPGRPLGALTPKPAHTQRELGACAGAIREAFEGFENAAVPGDFLWDLRHGIPTARALLSRIFDEQLPDAEHRAMLRGLLERAEASLEPLWAQLPVGVIHGDLNDHNVLVDADGSIGIIDFGDLHRSVCVAEPAVAAAYAAFGFPDPVDAIASVAAGADERHPLSDEEVAAIVPLVVVRLSISVTMATHQTASDPTNEYLAISSRDAWATLRQLDEVSWPLALARIRHRCGREPVAKSAAVRTWLAQQGSSLHGVLETPITEDTTCVLDWSVASPEADHPADATPVDIQASRRFAAMQAAGAAVGLGRYGEPRLVYTAPEFAVATNHGPQWRTVHLGVDLSAPPGTEVRALWDGVVARVEVEQPRGGYGPVVTLRHEPEPGITFFTLYGHLLGDSIQHLRVGDEVRGGDRVGAIGVPPENGDWSPHVHFQLITDHLNLDGPFPGVALADEWGVWRGVCPSPADALGLAPGLVDAPHPDETAVLSARSRVLPPSFSTSYARPVMAVRGRGAYLYDGWGRGYLDCVNNVAHVGHEHPYVVEALRAQAGVLNTNSRYPHPERMRYIERLAERLPDPLDSVFLVCSGSEANDLALRIARTVTQRRDLVVLAAAYHGHTDTLIEASPYKHDGLGGRGAPSDVHVAPLPDPYRSSFGADAGAHAAAVARAVLAADERGGPAAFLVESMPGVAGQIDPPRGYLAESFAAVRAAGGLCIADEVQVGLGRVGEDWWGFARDGVVPDIVTLGKPLGNGHPMAAVITSRAIAEAFANGMEYFNTFGGNPVSCAVGNAVLDVLDAEHLPHHAAQMGALLLGGLGELAIRHEVIGDVRGRGLFLGVELVVDRGNRTPAPRQASYVVERARDLGVLLSVDGLHHNVLKIKPPLVFGEAEVTRLVETLDEVLAEDGAAPER